MRRDQELSSDNRILSSDRGRRANPAAKKGRSSSQIEAVHRVGCSLPRNARGLSVAKSIAEVGYARRR